MKTHFPITIISDECRATMYELDDWARVMILDGNSQTAQLRR